MSSKSSECPFKIGQEVVAKHNHCQLAFRKDDKFFIKGIWKSCCGWIVDIGISGTSDIRTCIVCKKDYKKEVSSIWYFNTNNFVPVHPSREKTKIEIAQELLSLIPVVEEVSDKPVKILENEKG